MNTKLVLKKIVVIGPESTGKSTILRYLADYYKTLWCPEFARAYLLENGTTYTNEDLITIVGCGGDRDVAKRPKMGNIAASLSSKVIFTSDNPRSENPATIIESMEKGVSGENFNKTLSISDRKQAIKTACQLAKNGDIILIAGKGHETYQEIKGKRIDFDDYKIINELLIALNK